MPPTVDRYSTDSQWLTYRSSVGRHIDRYSADISVDISTDTRPISRPTYQSTYRPTYLGRYVGRVSADISTDTSAEYRSICRPTLDRRIGRYIGRYIGRGVHKIHMIPLMYTQQWPYEGYGDHRKKTLSSFKDIQTGGGLQPKMDNVNLISIL